ncbi:MAG TPA: hypothetical protein DDZ51_22240 [Planctomycetaceae bacterium]|nr:hypothetical protein [Planctomycetaceae bacterium]
MVRDENYTSPLDVDSDSSPAGDRLATQTPNVVPPDDDADPMMGAASIDGDEINDTVAESDASLTHDSIADETAGDEEWQVAQQAWDATQSTTGDESVESVALETGATSVCESIADPFVGRWNRLISSTNWEKGRIISQWRGTLIDAGAAVTEFSDEAWAKRVGGVTASHVGRLRRVYDVFGASYETYQGLYWTHFLVALDWDDAPLWLEGAVQSGWSVSQMRTQRWEATGGDASDSLSTSDAEAGELDEDFDETMVGEASDSGRSKEFTQPGQGGGSTKEYGDGPGAIGSGPAVEGPDFGDEESLSRLSDDFHQNAAPGQPARDDQSETPPPLVQPFAGLPELPNDLADAVELLKLAVLRHKTAGWKEVNADVVLQYLKAFNVLVEARGR